jgi:hypothetical protein
MEVHPMRTVRKAVACVAVGLALSAGFLGSAAAHRSAAATFSDPAGDAGGVAPDVTSVAIDGDPATRTMTVAVTATGYLPAGSDGMERDVNVYLDTDGNASTGSVSGSEYALVAWNDSTGRYWDMERWDGSTWQSMPQSATMSFIRGGDVLTWTLNASDLGGSTGFSFYVLGGTYSGDNQVGHDYAPDDGKWTYGLSAVATTTTTTTTAAAPSRTLTLSLTPVIGKPATAPVHPAAGKRLAISFPVARSDDQKPLAGGRVTATVSVGGKPVPHTQSFARGVARVSLAVPAAAKGKRVTVKLTVKAPSYRGRDGSYIDMSTGRSGTTRVYYSGRSATRSVSLPVR